MTTAMSHRGKSQLLRALLVALVAVAAFANGAFAGGDDAPAGGDGASGERALSGFARQVTYTYVNRRVSFHDASSTCTDMGLSLATIKTAEEQAAAKAVVSAEDVPANQWGQRSVWIGLTREGRDGWEWIDGSRAAYTPWGSGEVRGSPPGTRGCCGRRGPPPCAAADGRHPRP